jgi:hypothetical protein
VLSAPEDRRRYETSERQFAESGVRDYEFALDPTDAQPAAVFDRLRWGGQLIFVSPQLGQVEELLRAYRGKPEWRLEREPQVLLRLRAPGLARRLPRRLRQRFHRPLHFVAFRKVLLDPVSRLTARHSYDVRLERARGPADQPHAVDGLVVLKRVPSLAQAVDRLRQTVPDASDHRLEQIAAKLVRKVFPAFLTREAAFLKLLQRDLPEPLRARTPRVLSMETDDRGRVSAMSLNWLRQGGPTISQTEFARQSAELLRAVHDAVGVMHLDLRLDNMVVTEAGVGLVDFGSSARIGEDLTANPLLAELTREMLAASQITRDMRRQRKKNLIRADIFRGLPWPPTPAFDLFALATNLTRPHDHDEFRGLIAHDRHSEEGLRFSRLRKQILKPAPDDLPITDLHALCRELGIEGDRPTRSRQRSAPRPVILTGPHMPRPDQPRPLQQPLPRTLPRTLPPPRRGQP